MAVKGTQFVSAAAVADYNQGHYIEMPVFQDGMLDLLNREVTILDRIKALPATGHPTRYWEQTKIAHNAKFVDPRTGENGKYGVETIDDDYGRVEKSAMLKAMTSEIKYSLFDRELVKQQGQFEYLLNKDMQDMIVDFRRTQNQAIWTGKATDLATSGGSNEYMGLDKQITTAVNVANPVALDAELATNMVFVTDALRGQIAKQLSDNKFIGFPTAVYANPLTIEYLTNAELKRKGVQLPIDVRKMDIGNGFQVFTIRTQRGELPVIPDPFIPVEAGKDGKFNHTLYAVNENLIERHYLTSAAPRVFKMSNSKELADDYVAVLFDTVIAKGAAAGAHFKLTFKA